MNNPITRAQVTFRHAARAAGVTEKTLRNWLDRGQVILSGDDDREEGTWRRFSILDVVRLAIIGRISAYGLAVRDAAEIVSDMVDDRTQALMRFRSTPPGALVAGLHGLRLAIQKFPDGVGHQVARSVGHEDLPDTEGWLDFAFFHCGEIAATTLTRLDDEDAAGD